MFDAELALNCNDDDDGQRRTKGQKEHTLVDVVGDHCRHHRHSFIGSKQQQQHQQQLNGTQHSNGY